MEIWKKIEGFDDRYEASNLGRLRSTNYKRTGKTKILKPAETGGYLKTMLLSKEGKYRTITVHRMVIMTFKGKSNDPNRQEINHINGIKTDNSIDNLEWCSRSENCQHSFDTGLQKPKRGELNGMAKLTREQVEYARKRKREGGRFWGRKELAKEFGISEKHLQRIVNKDTAWKELI